MATAGRQWVDTTKLMEDRARRLVTFSRRRRTVFATASDLSSLDGVDTAAVVFSEAGNVFAFGSPSVDAVLRRLVYSEQPLPGDEPVDLAVLAAKRQQVTDAEALEAAEKERMEAVGAKVKQAVPEAGSARWWEADARALREAELLEFERELGRRCATTALPRSMASSTISRYSASLLLSFCSDSKTTLLFYCRYSLSICIMQPASTLYVRE